MNDSSATPSANSVVPVHMPQENVNDETVKIIAWLVGEGDSVQAGQPLVEVETSKSTFEIQSPAAGVLCRVVAEKLEVPVGDVLCYVGENLAAIDAFRTSRTVPVLQVNGRPSLGEGNANIAERKAAQGQAEIPDTQAASCGHGTRISHAAGELIRAHGLSEDDFAGQGLVRQSDVLARLGQPAMKTALESAPRAAVGVPVRRESLPRSKRIESRLLSWGVRQAIRSTVTVAVPTLGLAALKSREPGAAETLSAAVIFESARLLRKYPHLNAFAADDQASFYEEVNIGYALDAGRGLKVPVLRQADGLTLPELVAQRRQYLTEYLNDALRPEAMAGATFMVTDLSADDVFTFDPLFVEAQAAILGVGGEFRLPGAVEGAYNLILAFDHRLVEGRMAARFLGDLKSRLQAHEVVLSGQAAGAPAAKPCCHRCLATLDQIQRMEGFLLQSAGNSPQESKFICSICLAGF